MTLAGAVGSSGGAATTAQTQPRVLPDGAPTDTDQRVSGELPDAGLMPPPGVRLPSTAGVAPADNAPSPAQLGFDFGEEPQVANSTQPGVPTVLTNPAGNDGSALNNGADPTLADTSGPQATGTATPATTLAQRLQAELDAQNATHQAFQTAADSANKVNMVPPRVAAAAAATNPQATTAAGQGGSPPPSNGPGYPPGWGPNGPNNPNQAGSPLGGGQFGAPGTTFTDVATRQKAIQDDLNQAQTIYTQMAADRYKWISTMQRIWQDMKTSILENIMGAVKNRIETFNKITQGIIGALFGGG